MRNLATTFFYLIVQIFIFSIPAQAEVERNQFESIVNEFQQFFTLKVKEKGYQFLIQADWNQFKKDASIKIPNKKVILTITGGMAREKLMSEDALRLILCHEMGHFFGGAPKINKGHWSSTEGQADYYSTSKCILNFIKNNQIKRVKEASLILAKITALQTGEVISEDSFNKKDISVVTRTTALHSSAQCRLDTLIAGLNCQNSSEFSDENPEIGACLSINDLAPPFKARPGCWYRPPLLGYSCKSNESFLVGAAKVPLMNARITSLKSNGSVSVALYVTGANPASTVVAFKSLKGTDLLVSGEAEIEDNSSGKLLRLSKTFLLGLAGKSTLIKNHLYLDGLEIGSGENYLINLKCQSL